MKWTASARRWSAWLYYKFKFRNDDCWITAEQLLAETGEPRDILVRHPLELLDHLPAGCPVLVRSEKELLSRNPAVVVPELELVVELGETLGYTGAETACRHRVHEVLGVVEVLRVEAGYAGALEVLAAYDLLGELVPLAAARQHVVVELSLCLVHVLLVLEGVQVEFVRLDVLDYHVRQAFLAGELHPFGHGRVQLCNLETGPVCRVHLDDLVERAVFRVDCAKDVAAVR